MVREVILGCSSVSCYQPTVLSSEPYPVDTFQSSNHVATVYISGPGKKPVAAELLLPRVVGNAVELCSFSTCL